MAKKNKKQATEGEVEPELNTNNDDSDDSHNKKKLKKKRMRKKIPTVSIAVPASIIDNVPTLELATRVLSIQDPPFSIFSIFPSFFLILFSLFSWLVKSLVPQPFSESTRLLKLLCSLHFHILLIIIRFSNLFFFYILILTPPFCDGFHCQKTNNRD